MGISFFRCRLTRRCGGGGVCGVILCGQWAVECADPEDGGDGEGDGEDAVEEQLQAE